MNYFHCLSVGKCSVGKCSIKKIVNILYVTKIKHSSLPSPLDDLINQLGGPGKVAEMTGRRGRVVKTDKQPQPHYEARESDSSSVDSLNIQEVRGSKIPSYNKL